MESANELDPRRFSGARPPGMVLGGLNICRALGLAGIPVIVASSTAHEVAFASRYCSGRLRLPSHEGRRAMADSLLAAGKRLAGSLGRRLPLFYCNDDWQRLVQDYRSELAQHYSLLLNDADVAGAVIEKHLFQPLAAARGLPVPRTLEWDELERVEGPVLVKPRTKFDWGMSSVYLRLFRRQGKARIFSNGRELLADAAARQLRDELLIQEYVAGDDRQIWSFHGFSDENSQLLDWFIGRKIRTYPVLTGLSTYLELAHDDELAALGRGIAAALPLKGVFKIDLKRDPRIGRFRVLEINARYNLWHYLGAANKVNLPRTAYEYLVYGKRPAASRGYRTTHRWIYLRYDWHAYRQLASRGELGFPAWLASLAAAPKVCHLFGWSDPLPFFNKLYHFMKSRLPRLASVLRRWLSTAS
jgi:predicted ATP-grasp superfamily ATP-dependent carboligase